MLCSLLVPCSGTLQDGKFGTLHRHTHILHDVFLIFNIHSMDDKSCTCMCLHDCSPQHMVVHHDLLLQVLATRSVRLTARQCISACVIQAFHFQAVCICAIMGSVSLRKKLPGFTATALVSNTCTDLETEQTVCSDPTCTSQSPVTSSRPCPSPNESSAVHKRRY